MRTPAKQYRRLALFVTLLLIPAWPAWTASGGSTWNEGAPFEGTARNVTTGPNIALAFDESGLNNWTMMEYGEASAREDAAMAYDPVKDELVVFGGVDGALAFNDTWSYNMSRNSWTHQNPAAPPRADGEPYMAYDAASGEMVCYGGSFNYTWKFNLSTNTWTDLSPAASPPKKGRAAMAYDSARRELILFGGNQNPASGSAGRKNDTWAYNITTNTWTNRNPPNAPPPRNGHAMAYDSVMGEVVMFGGENVTMKNDTWTYNPGTNRWTNRTKAISPQARSDHAMAYDPVMGETVLFGYPNETWTYNLSTNTWKERNPTAPPYSFYQYTMTYDSRGGEIVLFGGDRDLWTYNLSTNTWAKRNPQSSPVPRFGGAMAFDSVNGEAVLWGGRAHARKSDTWTYNIDKKAWTNRLPGGNGIYGHAMVYDAAWGEVVGFGGRTTILTDATYTYNMSANAWRYRNPVDQPKARYGHAMAYHPARDEVILFGGYDGTSRPGHPYRSDTWVYNLSNNAWRLLGISSAPPARMYHSMAYDEASGEIVLFGGQVEDDACYGDTWTFNLTNITWTNQKPATSPPARSQHAMAYDRARGEMVLFGGQNNGSCLGDTWTYNLSTNNWSNQNPGTAPLARYGMVMAYDDEREEMVLFGGMSPYGLLGDTWTFNHRTIRPNGDYTSAPIDTGGSAHFGALSWDATTPPNTTLRIRLRTAATSAELETAPFIGPTGMENFSYVTSGQAIYPGHNGHRWVQYRARLATGAWATPVLRGVTIGYNLLHDVSLAAPSGGESWTGVQDICWTADDPDGDRLAFDIFLLDGSGSTPLATDLPDATRSFQWNTTAVPNGTYRIQIVARDDNATIPLSVNATSADFTIRHPTPNTPPAVTLIAPGNNATINTTTADLAWNGSDIDGDALTYQLVFSDVQFERPEAPPQGALVVATGNTTYAASGLVSQKTYFWAVIPGDGKASGTPSAVWRFTVALNSPPSVTLIGPPDGAVVNTTAVTLSWNGTDADGDEMTFFVLFSAAQIDPGSPPPPAATLRLSEHRVAGLSNGTAYYWTVVASDGKVNGSTPPARRFTVELAPGNRAPLFTSAQAANAVAGAEFTFTVTARDDDGDNLVFSLVTGPPGMAVDGRTGRLTWTPAATGSYFATIRVSDEKGGEALQQLTIIVTDKPAADRPVVAYITPSEGQKVRGRFTVTGTATKGSINVTGVQVRIDSGAWMDALGKSGWQFTLDTAKLKNGKHTLQARAFDGIQYSDIANRTITVDNQKAPAKGFIPMIDGLVLMAVFVGAAAILTLRRR